MLFFKHSDVFYISGGPEYQREYIDQILFLNHLDYTMDYQRYKKILLQKNSALKQDRYNIIDIYNEQLASFGINITKYRYKIIQYINQYLSDMFSKIFGDRHASYYGIYS